MDGIPPEGEGETMEWELLHNNNNDDDDDAAAINELAPPLESCALIRPDHFSIHPPTPLNSNSSSSSSSTELDRNFDDSYLANHLFPYLHSHQHQHSSSSAASSHNLPLSHDSDSDSDSKPAIVLQTTTEDLLLDTQAAAAGGALNSKEEEEEEAEGENRVLEEEGLVQEEERSAVWWKVPLEVFKYWVVRVSPVPVWSLSVAAAAAFLGLVILGRRLYKMKRKTQTLKLNVALDDKKVSQLMGRVARLNEAFSVVRRVPIVRPSLPAPPSVTLRPVMSIR